MEAFFADPPPEALETCTTTGCDHGRIETHHHAVCHGVAWLFSDRRYPGEVAFPGLAMIGMVEAETKREGKAMHERRYYLSSAKLDATTFAQAVRGHWGIENQVHWVLDMVFDEDHSRMRERNSATNVAMIRRMALNMLRQDQTDKLSLRRKRLRAGWDHDYLRHLLNF